jgi:hypothetical protein
MHQVPMLLTKAGMSWRWAEPADLTFIVASWFSSTLKPFVSGALPCPWPGLEKTVAAAREAGNEKLLRRIWHTEGKSLIGQRLMESPTLVVFDQDDPAHILAWRNSAYGYTKQLARRQGLQRAMQAALAQH